MNLDFNLTIILFPLLLLFTSEAVEAVQDTPRFDILKQTFNENRVFAARFTHEYFDAFTGENQRSSGDIWIGKDRYKIEGDNHFVLVEDGISTVYDGSRQRVIVSDYVEEEDDFAPSKMLQGVDDTFSVSEQILEDGNAVIFLRSEDPFSVFSEVSIYLSREGAPTRIEATDQIDNKLITRFEQGHFIDETPELFRINIPQGTEQIDLRYETP